MYKMKGESNDPNNGMPIVLTSSARSQFSKPLYTMHYLVFL